MPTGPDRKVQNRSAQPSDSLRKIAVSAIQYPVAQRKHCAAAEEPQRDTPGWPNPVVVERIFQKEGDGKCQCEDSNIEKPSPSNQSFEINTSSWDRRRRTRQRRGWGHCIRLWLRHFNAWRRSVGTRWN